MPDFYGSWERHKEKKRVMAMEKEKQNQYRMAIVPGLLRNDGVGDYFENADGSWTIQATRLPDIRHSHIILIHEAVETMLIKAAGIPEPVIDAFDALFEIERKFGLHSLDDEPGDDPRAPYFKEHQIATKIERVMCVEGYGLSWEEYSKACLEAE